MKEPTSIDDLSPEDREEYEIWLRDFVSPITLTEAEADELARFEATKQFHGTPHEL